jgi:hypothetical protein
MSGKNYLFGRLMPHIYTTIEYLFSEEGRAQKNAQKPY